jgi:hypothetical protein
LHHTTLVLLSKLSDSLLSSSLVIVSRSLVKIKGQCHNSLCELVVGMALTLSKICFIVIRHVRKCICA